MSDASQSSDTSAKDQPRPSLSANDFILLAVLLLVAALITLCGGGMLVGGLLLFVTIISMMTIHAVMEERGPNDPAVRRARRSLFLMGACLLPVTLAWLFGFHPAIAVVLMFVAGLVAIWNLRSSPARFTLRTFLRGANEKEPGYLDLQGNRAFLLFLVALAFLMFGDSLSWKGNHAPSERERLAALSAAANELLETVTQLTVDTYADGTTEKKMEFLDNWAKPQDDAESPNARVFFLSRILQVEDDPARQTRIVNLLNADTDLQLAPPPSAGYTEAQRQEILRGTEEWIARQ